MLKYGIYSVQDGSKLVRILVGLFIAVSIIYFVFGRKTAGPQDMAAKDEVRHIRPPPPPLTPSNQQSASSSRDRSHRNTDTSKVNLIAPPIPDDIIAKSKDNHNIITEGTITVQV